jgi:hypothetical protein|tara:strand:+ start:93916 stop:94554 length:639 start_codon:yes stop_codon:yes gene_type:complete
MKSILKKHFTKGAAFVVTGLSIFFLFSCGHYQHRILTDTNRNVVNTIKNYGESKSYSDRKRENYYVVHFGDSLFSLKNARFGPEYMGQIKKEYKKWKSDCVENAILIGEFSPLNKSDESIKKRVSVYNYMKEHPKGKLQNKRADKNFVYQTHIYVDSLNLKNGILEISDSNIRKVDVYYRNKQVKRWTWFGIGTIFTGSFIVYIVNEFQNIS